MKIVVVGGSGLVGSKLVTMLTHDGQEVVAARISTFGRERCCVARQRTRSKRTA